MYTMDVLYGLKPNDVWWAASDLGGCLLDYLLDTHANLGYRHITTKPMLYF